MDKNTIECTLKSDIDQQITLAQRRGIKSISTNAKVGSSSIGNTARVIEMKAGQPVKISLQVNDLPKNLGLNQDAYHSSCINYDNIGHLVTDGNFLSRDETKRLLPEGVCRYCCRKVDLI